MPNDLILGVLKKKKSEAGSEIECLGVATKFLLSYEETIASLRLSENRTKKLVGLMEHLASKRTLSLAELQKAAGKLCFAQTMIMGRFGRAALMPFYDLITKGGGELDASIRGILAAAAAHFTQNRTTLDPSST